MLKCRMTTQAAAKVCLRRLVVILQALFHLLHSANTASAWSAKLALYSKSSFQITLEHYMIDDILRNTREYRYREHRVQIDSNVASTDVQQRRWCKCSNVDRVQILQSMSFIVSSKQVHFAATARWKVRMLGTLPVV